LRLVGLLLVLPIACGSSAQPSGTSTNAIAGGSMTVRISGDFRSLDPQTLPDAPTVQVVSTMYATLLALDKAGKPIPYIAKSWKATANAITFNLRGDVSCSDGTPLSATVVKNSLQRLIDSKSTYNALNFGPAPYTVTGDDSAGTVTFTSGGPFGDLVYGFTPNLPGSQSGIICPAGLPKGTDFLTKSYGAGPYTLVEAVHGDHVTLKLRPEFKWGPQAVTASTVGIPSTLTFKTVGSDTTAANLLLTGGLDAAQINGPDVNRLLNDTSVKHSAASSWNIYQMIFNMTPGRPAADEKVRQALITAVDAKAFNQAATGGRGTVMTSVFTADMQCYDPNTARLIPKTNLDAAKKILTDDGYTYVNGKATKNGKPLSLKFVGSLQFGGGPEYVLNQYNQLGVTVEFSNPDFGPWGLAVQTSNFDVTLYTPSSPGPFPGPVAARLSGNLPPKGTNFALITDPVVNQEGAAGRASTGEEACKHWTTFQEQILKGWYVQPLMRPPADIFTKGVDISMGAFSGNIPPLYMRRVKQ
jgi:peptide/nickel transport system substrate-binding protein